MRQSQEVLGSRLDPRHRTAEPPGRCQCDRVLRGDAGLAAEATTDVGAMTRMSSSAMSSRRQARVRKRWGICVETYTVSAGPSRG